MPSSKEQRKKEIKRREDPGVWENEMQRRGEEEVLMDWLRSEQRAVRCRLFLHLQPGPGQTLVEVLIRLSCLQDSLLACD